MYPFINAFGTELHMTWIWIVIFILVFLRRTKKYITTFQGDRSLFSKLFPLYLLVLYLVSSYTRYAIEEFVFFPTSITQILAYISPFEYKFHLIWLIIWCARCIWHFFRQVRDTNMQLKWIDARFLWAMRACIPLGIFLLLWDTFIGQPTDGSIFVSAFHPESNVASFDKVIPLWLYLSFVALLLLIWTKILRYKKAQLRWYGLIGWIVFLLMFCFLILFQEYARRLVFKLLGKTRDIRNIVLLCTSWYLIRKYKHTYEFFAQLH